MVRESGISATKPVFPGFLLPSFKIPFRRRSSSSSWVSSPSTISSPATTPDNSPPTHAHFAHQRGGSLSRASPDTIRCKHCASDLALTSQIISKGFTGRYGRAFLVSPSPTSADQKLLNIRIGRSENRQLVTGWHVVADITCGICMSKLGWKYVDAREESQKYKVGKYILETERTVMHRVWEDFCVSEMEDYDGLAENAGAEYDKDEVVFNSDDEDECDDVFAGTWDPNQVAQRRSQMVTGQMSEA